VYGEVLTPTGRNQIDAFCISAKLNIPYISFFTACPVRQRHVQPLCCPKPERFMRCLWGEMPCSARRLYRKNNNMDPQKCQRFPYFWHAVSP
jgi:hypothetical protein